MSKQPQKELEYKFSPAANRQFKFTTLEPAATVARRAMAIFKIMGVRAVDLGEHEIRDTYLDTTEGTLQKAGFAVRLRQEKSRNAITIKADGKQDTEHLDRKEDEFEVSRNITSQTVPSKLVSDRLRTHFKAKLDLGILQPKISIVNRRYSIRFDSNSRNNTFCYDKYYPFDEESRTYGHLSSEIEIEAAAARPEKDIKLQRIIHAFREIFLLESNQKSKLKRAIEQLRNPEVRPVHTLGLDVVGYSTRTADVQSQIIQCLNKFAKDAIRMHRAGGPVVHEIYIPTGDGMFIVFEDRPESIIPIICELQKAVKAWCEGAPGKYNFSFRTAIHSGPVFKYSDINENLNYAGNGINLAARLLGLGQEWSIVASRDAHEMIGRTSEKYSRCFTEIGDKAFKHGEEINVWNFYDPDSGAGTLPSKSK